MLLLAISRTLKSGLVCIHSAHFIGCVLYAHLSHLQPDIDPVTAQTPFFSRENASKWAVPEQWHAYRIERRQEQRQALSRSGAAVNRSPKKG
jgi:hypothetical protein